MKSIRDTEFNHYHLTVPVGTGCTVEESEDKMQTVHEVCQEIGISRKTLYYYDKIGLLKPTSRRGKQHGKMYSNAAVARLREILLYQGAGLTLKEIDAVMNHDDQENLNIFLQARERLSKKRDTAERQIEKLDELIQLTKKKENEQ